MKQYRLNSEQETKLKTFVSAFAYAEEFTCYPPTLFMILGKLAKNIGIHIGDI